MLLTFLMFVEMLLARGAEGLSSSQDSQLHCHHRSWTKVTEWQPREGSHLDQNSPSSYSFGFLSPGRFLFQHRAALFGWTWTCFFNLLPDVLQSPAAQLIQIFEPVLDICSDNSRSSFRRKWEPILCSRCPRTERERPPLCCRELRCPGYGSGATSGPHQRTDCLFLVETYPNVLS